MPNDLALMRSHIKKMDRVFKIVLTILTLLELALMLRGLIFFNLERLKLRMYLYSYIFLFVTSLAALLVFWICGTREKHSKKLVVTIYLYAFCLIAWSTVVSCIDCYANGDSGIMVYVMTCIAVGVLTLIKPWVFLIYMGVSGTVLAVLLATIDTREPYSSGFYINFVVFVVLTLFINSHNYRLSKREFESSQALKKLSYTDQLTGVFNRRRLDENVSRCIKEQKDLVFVLLDIDDFKKVNDTYGHPEGDRCLVELARMLTDHFGDHVYRFGGDEFAVIPSMSAVEACEQLDEINREFGNAFGSGPDLHISAGVYAAAATDTPADLFSKADKALYQAKDLNKAHWVLYEES